MHQLKISMGEKELVRSSRAGPATDNSASSLLRPLMPLADSVPAVPATAAICERLFKAGGQVLTNAMRLRLLGSRL